MDQLTLDFEPGLTDRFQRIEDVVVHTVYSGDKPQKAIAYDLDESPSSLSRKVKGDLGFPISKLPALIDSTGDFTVVLWLVEKYLVDHEAKKSQAISRLADLVPQIEQLIKEANA